MGYRESLAKLDAGERLYVTCPDGVERYIWGYNPNTGDLFVAKWSGDVFMDCSDGTLRVTFE